MSSKRSIHLPSPRVGHRGSALVVVLIFIAVFGVLAVGYLSAAGANLRGAELRVGSQRARMAAESGLTFIRRALTQVDIGDTAGAQETLEAIAAGLNTELADTLFDGQQAQVENGEVVLPAVILNFPEGSAQFQLTVTALSDDRYTVSSEGSSSQCCKAVSVDFEATRESTLLADYGIASRSRISMTGNPSIQGVNHPLEGSVLSTTMSDPRAVDLVGNVDISGDVSITNPDGQIRIVGNCDIGGETRIGVENPEFPTVEGSIFEPYAVNVIDAGTSTSGNQYFENVRIVAGTDPTFSGNITMRGVVYVESPNQVTFTGNLDLVGVVVTEENSGELDLASHAIKFTGNTSTNSVEALPQDPQFDGLRDLTGSFLLAPGYDVEFTGNFSTINGSILASKFTFSGNANGTVSGSVLNYNDTDFVMKGNSRLKIDHGQLDTNPTGLVFPRHMVYLEGSYSE